MWNMFAVFNPSILIEWAVQYLGEQQQSSILPISNGAAIQTLASSQYDIGTY